VYHCMYMYGKKATGLWKVWVVDNLGTQY